MKLRHAFLLALGIATPLWLRQIRFERYLARQQHEYMHGMNDVVSKQLRQHAQVWSGTVKQIERAFGVGKRRKVEL